jgi:lipopolysaccharide/colanic/teichoic acid biosynthesis glycosyltransferase
MFFRRTKIDELPQLFNVLWGDMSFVGPRPDVPGFADRLEGVDRIILSVRPGITGPASLKYRDEEALLASQEDPERYNREVIWPDKVRINLDYVKHWSFAGDIGYILKTVAR